MADPASTAPAAGGERRMSFMTQMEIAEAIAQKRAVILPTGATEAHGPHMPTDTDTHQVEHIAWLLAQRIDALVAPPVAYGISKTFEFFPGTISLSIPTYQAMLFEIGAALVRQGFEHLILLNGNRPNGTANDAVARHLVDELDAAHSFKVSAVSYWEPAAERIHALRQSVPGGMGHGCEFETGFQLATRPELVKMDRLEGAHYGPVGWDLVAPTEPVRTYMRRPRPAAGHAAIFGDPSCATAEAGQVFIDTVVQVLEETFRTLRGSYEERR
ncbi:creatininase family protein [Methylobacterium organophilum]|uniref:Creatinine amidohydrolase n=1 Tax=Methylobacterium organophilum TaxID=410 RepID=A0ABQ4T9E6_METOR|nr:creatininase family protein [Methylobacterium organophilum]GJE26755.1 Creatinine amidohydrolase [Methylobacterium organophilum]